MTDVRNAEQFFRAMPPHNREKVEALLREYVWEFATATAAAIDPEHGRLMPAPGNELRDAIMEAGWEVFVAPAVRNHEGGAS